MRSKSEISQVLKIDSSHRALYETASGVILGFACAIAEWITVEFVAPLFGSGLPISVARLTLSPYPEGIVLWPMLGWLVAWRRRAWARYAAVIVLVVQYYAMWKYSHYDHQISLSALEIWWDNAGGNRFPMFIALAPFVIVQAATISLTVSAFAKARREGFANNPCSRK